MQFVSLAPYAVSDPALKEYLLFLDKELHFIMQDLDESHLLVDSSVEKFLSQKMDECVCRYYVVDSFAHSNRWYDQIHYTVPMYSAKK